MCIEFPVGLSPRAAHSWAFSAIEDTELDPAEIGDSGHKAVQSVDFPDQMAFSKPTNSGIAGHSANGGKPVGDKGRFCAHTGCRGRGFTAGVAAANHSDVESMGHQNLGWRLLAEARGGVKIIGLFKEMFHVKHCAGARKRIHLGCFHSHCEKRGDPAQPVKTTETGKSP